MKATARVITGSIRGRAQVISSPAAVAYALPTGIGGQARSIGSPAADAYMLPTGLNGHANSTEHSGLVKYIYVTPTEPQHLVWLVPQVGIDYQIETSTNLHWEIK